MISISDLKKQAKINRKNNNNLSNHSESLKAIANEYNYDSWEKLLDSSYLIANQKEESFQIGKKEQISWQHAQLLPYLSRIHKMIYSAHEEYDFFNNTVGYNTLFNFFQINILNKHVITSPVYQKIKLLIDFMISAFIESTDKDKTFKDILNYALLNKENPYFESELSINSSHKLKKYMKLNDLHIHYIADSHNMQISDTVQLEKINNHNEIILILNSVKEKINIMAKAYNIIENNKKDKNFLNSWLSDYENFISLGTYDEWVENESNQYQRLLQQHYSSFFNTNEHKKVLEYLNYYKNNQYGKFIMSGSKKEVIEKIKNHPEYSEGFVFDIEKASSTILGHINTCEDLQDYEFLVYYIIH